MVKSNFNRKLIVTVAFNAVLIFIWNFLLKKFQILKRGRREMWRQTAVALMSFSHDTESFIQNCFRFWFSLLWSLFVFKNCFIFLPIFGGKLQTCTSSHEALSFDHTFFFYSLLFFRSGSNPAFQIFGVENEYKNRIFASRSKRSDVSPMKSVVRNEKSHIFLND